MIRTLAIFIALSLAFSGVVIAADVEACGRIYANFNYNFSGYPDWDSRHDDNDFAEFEITRAYLGAKATFKEDWTAVVVGDVMRTTTTKVEPIYDDNGDLVDLEVEETKGAYMFFAKYAYGQYEPADAFGMRLGIMPTPYIDRYEKAWGYRFVEKTPSDRVGWDSSSDAGLAALGKFPGDRGSYYVMVRNGEGYKKPEGDSGKSVHARLLLTPFQSTAATRKLQLTGSYRYERDQRQDPEITTQMVNLLLSYAFRIESGWGVKVGAGFDSLLTDTKDADRHLITGQIYHGYAVLDMPYDFAIFGRADWLDPDMKNDQDTHGYHDETLYLLGGVSLRPLEDIALALDVKRTSYTEEMVDVLGHDTVKTPDTVFYFHTEFKF